MLFFSYILRINNYKINIILQIIVTKYKNKIMHKKHMKIEKYVLFF